MAPSNSTIPTPPASPRFVLRDVREALQKPGVRAGRFVLLQDVREASSSTPESGPASLDMVRSLAMMSGLGVLLLQNDRSIRLWDLSGEVLMEMVGHTSIVYSVDSHVSGLIISRSEDCFAKIWKDGVGVCVQTIEHPGCVWDAKFLENGDIVTACSDGVVRIWTINRDKIADDLELQSYFSLLTKQKISRYGPSPVTPMLSNS
ncbi:hypothetical protein J5N97_000388 [Dioscorea zingiberensis]|uniref:Uncharacterized protein n=1 Tax=Dioscorea zingiberensis TaxID=325984 RepID=A0A9D5BSJ7_9LILI|nr:hypothetical protein J5N97_000388 [Dioscorea zingiberensis]